MAARRPLHPRLSFVFTLWLCAACAGPARESRPNPEGWIRTELYFGLTRPGGARISLEEWNAFIEASVVPRFPDGFTVLDGHGEYRGSDGQTHREPSAILIVLHPRSRSREDGEKLDAISREYDRRVDQESVLRSDSDASAQFITGKP